MPHNRWPKPELTESRGCEVHVVLVPGKSRGEVKPISGHAVVVAGGVHGTDYEIRSLFWLSRFTDVARRVAAYRNRGVALGNWVGVSRR